MLRNLGAGFNALAWSVPCLVSFPGKRDVPPDYHGIGCP